MKNYRQILGCVAQHYEIINADAKGYTFIKIDCHDCNNKSLCNRIKGIIENDINLHKVGDKVIDFAKTLRR